MSLILFKHEENNFKQFLEKNKDAIIIKKYEDLNLIKKANKIIFTNIEKWNFKNIFILYENEIFLQSEIYIFYETWNQNLEKLSLFGKMIFKTNEDNDNENLKDLLKKKDIKKILNYFKDLDASEIKKQIILVSKDLTVENNNQIATYWRNNESLESIVISLMFFLETSNSNS